MAGSNLQQLKFAGYKMPFSYTKLIRKGALKGILGGHRGWQVGLFILVVGQLLRKAVKRGSGVVTHSQKIPVGEGLEVLHQRNAEEKSLGDE